ncbi:hypothetical protein CR513_43757, partial [Mucuna pruriens]
MVNYQTLFTAVIIIGIVLGGCAVAVYCLITKILCNEKYSITAYQKALAKASSMERGTSISHQIPTHKYEKKNHDDVVDAQKLWNIYHVCDYGKIVVTSASVHNSRCRTRCYKYCTRIRTY